jgi:hypothetical protein
MVDFGTMHEYRLDSSSLYITFKAHKCQRRGMTKKQQGQRILQLSQRMASTSAAQGTYVINSAKEMKSNALKM